MKSIMISIQPQWVEKILNGEKTIEIRKTMPKCKFPVKVFIYCTKGKPYLYRVNDDNEFELTNKLRFQDSSCFAKDYNAQNGKVVAEFTLKEVETLPSIIEKRNGTGAWYQYHKINDDILNKSYISQEYLLNYANCNDLWAWHIDDLKIYDKPKELSEFRKRNECHYESYEDGCCLESCTFYYLGECDGRCSKIERPPQSWFYIEELEDI